MCCLLSHALALGEDFLDAVVDAFFSGKTNSEGYNFAFRIEENQGGDRAHFVLIDNAFVTGIVNVDTHERDAIAVRLFEFIESCIGLLAGLAPGSIEINYSGLRGTICAAHARQPKHGSNYAGVGSRFRTCLLYTSDAADE